MLRTLALVALLVAATTAQAQSTDYARVTQRGGAFEVFGARGDLRLFARPDTTSGVVFVVSAGAGSVAYERSGAFWAISQAGVGHIGYALVSEVTRDQARSRAMGGIVGEAATTADVAALQRDLRTVKGQTTFLTILAVLNIIVGIGAAVYASTL